MRGHETSTLCQPDGRKGCSACCGLFNFRDISRRNLTRFLSGGQLRSDEQRSEKTDTDAGSGVAVRDMTSYICPHQGFIYSGRPGCLIHPSYVAVPGRCNSFFGEKICNSFLCPAHLILNEEQKKTIIELIDDWYYYSIAVIDPGSVAWFLALLSEGYRIKPRGSDGSKKMLNTFLEIHSRYLRDYAGPIFFYSATEYFLGNKNFSLSSDAVRLGPERKEILEAVGSNL